MLNQLSQMLIAAGPTITAKNVGKIKKTMGISIFTGSLAAISSAFWNRLVRKESENTRNALVIPVPNISVWIIKVTSDLRLSMLALRDRLRRASWRAFPALVQPGFLSAVRNLGGMTFRQ